MIATEGIAWTVYGIIALTSFLFSVIFTRYFQNKYENEFFATLVTILSLGLVFSTLCLLPVDIFLVSTTVDPSTGLKKSWATPQVIQDMTFHIRLVYYVCYGLITLSSFFFIPFAYFFYEEYDEEESIKDRILSAFKYTSFFIVISILLFIFGLFLKPSVNSPKIDLDWFRKLITDSNGEKAITFVVACLILLGMLVFIGYTAPGLSLLPINLIKGRKGLEAENEDVENRLTATKERQRVLRSKYIGRATMSMRDQRQLDELEDQERILSKRWRGIQQDRSSIVFKMFRFIRPFEFLLGLFLLCVTVILVASIFLTIVDKIAFSLCGSQCGYVINHPNLFNPINYIFVKLNKIFPLDYLFMVGLILYFFMATMSGIIAIGIRFLWMTLFSIKKSSTVPQGLLVTALLLTLSLLALNYTMTTTVVPGYAHFGSQVYCNQTIGVDRDCTDRQDLIVHCDVFGPTDICTPTVSSTMIDRIIVNTPFFGIAFYYSQWVFLVTFVIGLIVSLLKRPRNNVDAEDLVDEEQDGLLRPSSSTYGAS